MKNDVLIQLKSFLSVALLFWSKRASALWAFAVVFAAVHLLPANSWLGGMAHSQVMSYEMSGPGLGRMLAVALACIFILLVTTTVAERRPGSVPEWVVRGLHSLVVDRALSKVTYLAMALFGACAGFGVEGFAFGLLFLLWIYLVVSCVHALAMFARMLAR